MKNNIKYIIVFAILSFVLACGHKHAEGDGHDHGKEMESHKEGDGHDHGKEEHHEEEGLHLSSAQIKTIGLAFGDFSKIKVNDYVKATGTLGLPPNAYASVSAKAAGIVSGNKKYIEGKYIKKGEIIAYIANPDFIIKQQEYLEAKAQLNFQNLELERQKKLVEANAGVVRNFQNAKTQLAILEAKSMSLEKQLSYLGISTDNLTANSIKQQIPIIAPMSGYITSIKLHNGMYAEPMVVLMEIISDKHLHLELDVFEKDIANIKLEQKITYVVPALGNTKYEGEISIIGKEFDAQSKTLRIHGHLKGAKPIFLRDLFINAKIWLNDDTANAIPEAAIIKDGASSFIYVAKEDSNAAETMFEKIRLIPGASNNGYTAIKLLEEIPEGMKIVVKGAYYVYAQSKAGELEHEH